MSRKAKVLDGINGPDDLKNLTPTQLVELADELRKDLISRVAVNGGHLASNLGAVELTLALHRVFSSPTDKLVWDVGHQAYVHKILTGRKDRLHTLRQYQGLSGFPDPGESPHDAFGAGHASTSISAALGIAMARDMAGEDYNVVAVIGDGALTGGMAFEGLNQAGLLGCRLVVVLNDNGMAISPSVGAMAKALNKLRLDTRLRWPEKSVEGMVTKLPLGRQVGTRVKKSVKGFLFPKIMWEELGFAYMGPVDGHNIADLELALKQAKEYRKGPVFLHVITTKGKGYHPAENDAVSFHGLSASGSSDGRPSYSEILGGTVLRILEQDPKVVVITAAMVDGTGLSKVVSKFPKRVFDVGICEQHAVTFAAGLATQGYTPIVAIYSTFLQRAFDQVIHDVCCQKLPVVFAIDRAGIVGDDGKTHQGSFDLSYLGCIPNMVVAAAKDENELQHLIYTAVNARRPMAVRYPRGAGPGAQLDADLRDLPIGKAELIREGKDVTLCAFGSTVYPACEAASELEEYGLKCCVINARFLKPLDPIIREAAKHTGRMVTIEENTIAGGFGTAVLSMLHGSHVSNVQVKTIALPDAFIEHGSQQILRAKYRLDVQGIVTQVLSSFPEFSALQKSNLVAGRRAP